MRTTAALGSLLAATATVLLAAGCGATDSTGSSAPTSVTQLADTLGCASTEPNPDTAAIEEEECTLDDGTVLSLIEYGDHDTGVSLAQAANAFGVTVEFVTDVLAIAGDKPAVTKAIRTIG